jgi:hypothetical protein
MTVRRSFCNLFVLLLLALNGYAGTKGPDVSKVSFEITRASYKSGSLHWKIANNSDDGIYVFNFFLLGPAFHIERTPGRTVFETTPVVRKPGCPPNRVAPIALLFIRAGGVIEGDFMDAEVTKAVGNRVSLKIAIGSEPDTVDEEAKRFYNSNCAHSPYDAIVNWATLVESNLIDLKPRR